MYQPGSTPLVVQWTERRFWTSAWQSVPANVWFLGITSLLTDISSEMVASVLPAYLVVQLSLSPLAFGALDGAYNGVAAITRWGSGVMADRWRRYKEMAAIGYGLSAVCRLGLLVAGRAWTGLAIVIVADRLGKGIRTAPRDALISLSVPPRQLARAFGVHRALDATGAMLGPVMAFAILGLLPGAFDLVFVVSFCVAVVGVGVLLLFVQGASARQSDEEPAVSLPAATIDLLRLPGFRLVTIAAAGLAAMTISDAFIYLALQNRLQFAPALFPLLYVGTGLSYLLLAVPAGALADRFGRARVFLCGYGALLLVYAALMLPDMPAVAVLPLVVLVGAYYASTDGVVAALASGLLPERTRGSGLALLATATSVGRLSASIAFGWVWTTWSRDVAIASFAIGLGIAVAIAAMAVARHHRTAHG